MHLLSPWFDFWGKIMDMWYNLLCCHYIFLILLEEAYDMTNSCIVICQVHVMYDL